jgi:predicted nucleic acid-binding protein
VFARHRRIALDSNVLIYLLEGSAELGDKCAALLDAMALGEGEGVMATIAVAEICGMPAKVGNLALVDRYADELGSLDNVAVVPLSASVAVDAAVIRGGSGLSLMDAVHLATARDAGATAFVTNDRRIKPSSNLEVLYLDEI